MSVPVFGLEDDVAYPHPFSHNPKVIYIPGPTGDWPVGCPLSGYFRSADWFGIFMPSRKPRSVRRSLTSVRVVSPKLRTCNS